MGNLPKYFPQIAAVSIITVLYFSIRLFNLLSLPIFTDEAIYVRWAQIAANDPAWRFISLTDGKQPLFIWAAMIAVKLFEDPLYAGRFVSVFSGFGTIVGLFFLGRELFKNTWIGFTSAALYVISPFGLVYDRMALYDSMVAMFFIWGIYLSVLLVRRIRLDVALILGIIVGLSVLNKTNGFFGIYLLPFSLLLFDFKKKDRDTRILRWAGLAFLSAILTYGIYMLLRLSPWFYIIEEKNAVFVFPFSEWIKDPFTVVWRNLWQAQIPWVIEYMTIPIVIAVISSFCVFRKYLFEKIYLILIFLIPFVALAFFGRLIYPRYTLFMTIPLLLLAAFTLYYVRDWIKNKYVYWIVLTGIILFPLYSSIKILTDFAQSPIPDSDIAQYKTSWASGDGVNEAIEILRQEAVDKEIFVGTEGTFGLMPYALEIYLVDNPNITIKGYWPIENTPPTDVLEAAKKMPAYFIFYQECGPCVNKGEAPADWPVEEVIRVPKQEAGLDFILYRLRR